MEDDLQEISYKVIITESGQQIPVQASKGIDVSVFLEGDDTNHEVHLRVTPEEFENLQTLAVTNDIPTDILNANGADTPQ